MPATPLESLLLFLAGVVTGVLGAVLGTGGGVFLIPVLVIACGVPMHQAVATSLVAVIATSSAVASVNVARGTVNMRLGMTLEVATVLGAILGGLAAGWISARWLEGLFVLVLIPTALLMWRGQGSDANQEVASRSSNQCVPSVPSANASLVKHAGLLDAEYYDKAESRHVVYRVRRLWAGLLVALLAGGVSGLLGIGGGTFKVPALNLLCAVPMKAAAATSNFMIGVTAAASSFLYYGRGEVRPALTAASVLGVLAGSAIGSFLERHIRGFLVQRLFAVLLIVVACEMFARAFRG